MILYFDSFITDQPLHSWPQVRAIENKVQNGCYTYRKQSRLDITKYTLASYALLDWTHVLIKYELADSSQKESFEDFILDLFPKAEIFCNRSANQSEYRKSIEILEKFEDEWIFYSSNNDHPIVNSEIDTFAKLIQKAEQFKKQNNNFVSIYYSHFPESINAIRPGQVLHEKYWPDAKIVDEDENCLVVFFPKGELTSVQIVHRDLMKQWFCVYNFGDARVIRSECTEKFVTPPSQFVIIPKKEVCRHYDGYFHTILRGRISYIAPEKVPPLFIPDGFFEKKIKIAYGYEKFRRGWVNINPAKKKYSFQDNIDGTDMMCTLDDIPLFWKERIVEIDTNPKIDDNLMMTCRDEHYKILRAPWKNISRKKVFIYIIWLRLIRFLKSNRYLYQISKKILK